jgi:hypothetical protein
LKRSVLRKFLYLFCALSAIPSVYGMDLEDVGKEPSWLRVKSKFDRRLFLDSFNQKYSRRLGRVEPVEVDTSLDQKELTYACWRALYKRKEHCKERRKIKKYGFTYIAMGNLFLSSQCYPEPYKNAKRKSLKKYQFDLLATLQRKVTDRCEKKDKLYKWSLIARARLSMNYLKEFPNSHHRQGLLKQAYTALNEATKLKTTKTIYLLLAELVVDFKYTPEGLSREEAENKVKFWIDCAFQSEATSSPRRKICNTRRSLIQSFAKPTYMDMRAVTKDPRFVPASPNQKQETRSSLLDEKSEEDIPPENHNYFQLLIPVEDELDNDEVHEKKLTPHTLEEDTLTIEKVNLKECPSHERLKELYPDVKLPKGRTYEKHWIWKILYASEHLKLKNKDISTLEWVNEDKRRISDILCINGYKKKGPRFSDEDLEELYGAYLQYYEELQERTITKRQIAEALAKKIGQPEEIIVKKYNDFSGRKVRSRAKENPDLIKEKTEQITSMYKNKVSIYVIHKETNFSLSTIFKILSQNVKKDDRHSYLDLEIEKSELTNEKEKLTKERMEEVIFQKFNELKERHKGKRVPATQVADALERYDIGRGKFITAKIVNRVLKKHKVYQPLRPINGLNDKQREAGDQPSNKRKREDIPEERQKHKSQQPHQKRARKD